MIFKRARVFVCPAVCPPPGHQVALVEFMEEDIWPLRLLEIIVNPHLVVRDEFVHMIVPTFSEVDIKRAPNEPTVHYPYADP